MLERYSFVALTAKDLTQARAFWVGLLGLRLTEEREDGYFIVDAGGLRLCVDKEDEEIHRVGGTDPTIGLKVKSVDAALAELVARGLDEDVKIVKASRGAYAIIHDPEGRSVILADFD
jgi:catechol 2,3-dioxygenase-like lactoylglutathione lyase family enzyme